MTTIALGKISPPAPGTPIQVITDQTVGCVRITFCPVSTTGKIYIGVKGLNKTTLVGCMKAINPTPVSGILDQFEIYVDSGNMLHPSDYFVDSDNAGEGVLVSYYQK